MMKKNTKSSLLLIAFIIVTIIGFTNFDDSLFLSPPGASGMVNPTVMTAQNQNPILFLHGWTKRSTDWTTMRGWFRANEWPKTILYAYSFDKPGDSSVQGNINNANQIKQWVDEILEETGAEKIDLVGHSMGGISSRYYIKFLGGIDRVDDYVSLGCPHHGCPLEGESFSDANSLLLSLNEGDETPGGILNDTIGDRVAPYSGIIYNGTHIAGTINYTSIYSLVDEYIPPSSAKLHGANNIRLSDDIFHSQLYQDWSVYKKVRTAVDDFNTTFLMTPPTSFKAIPGDGQVKLRWEPPVDDGGTPITEYKVYRAANSGGPYSFIGNTTTLRYLDLNVTNEKNYYYVVTAVNNVGESEYSNEISAIPQIPIPTTNTSMTASPTSTTTTATPTPGWNGLFLLLSLFGLYQLRQLKKKS